MEINTYLDHIIDPESIVLAENVSSAFLCAGCEAILIGECMVADCKCGKDRRLHAECAEGYVCLDCGTQFTAPRGMEPQLAKFIKDCVMDFKCFCVADPCDTKMKIKELEAHAYECCQIKRPCKYNKFKCPKVDYNQKIKDHEEYDCIFGTLAPYFEEQAQKIKYLEDKCEKLERERVEIGYIPSGGNTDIKGYIKFKEPFKLVPEVIAAISYIYKGSCCRDSTMRIEVRIHNISKDGFEYLIVRGTSPEGPTNIHWIAKQR